MSCLTPIFDICPHSISFSPLPINIRLTSSQDLELRLFLCLNSWEEFRQPVGAVCACLTSFCWGRKEAELGIRGQHPQFGYRYREAAEEPMLQSSYRFFFLISLTLSFLILLSPKFSLTANRSQHA